MSSPDVSVVESLRLQSRARTCWVGFGCAVAFVCVVATGLRAEAQARTAVPVIVNPVIHIEDLLGRFARLGALRGKFREEKHVALLRTPLVSSGEVFFTKPGWIVRITKKPEASVVLLKDGQLTVVDPSGKRVLDVSATPVLRAFVEGFVQVLSGDRVALERNYELKFEAPPAGPWRLQLRPKDPALAKFLALLSFEGHGSVVERMVLRERNGDETATEFSSVEQLKAFDAAERERLFAAPR